MNTALGVESNPCRGMLDDDGWCCLTWSAPPDIVDDPAHDVSCRAIRSRIAHAASRPQAVWNGLPPPDAPRAAVAPDSPPQDRGRTPSSHPGQSSVSRAWIVRQWLQLQCVGAGVA